MKSVCAVLFAGLLGTMLIIGGCTKKPSQEELTQLEESRAAAMAAEKKLSELRTERESLEANMETKKQELNKLEGERDQLKNELGK